MLYNAYGPRDDSRPPRRRGCENQPMTCRTLLRELRLLVGVELTPTNHPEKWISAIGGFLGILAVLWISMHTVGAQSAAMVVASIGAFSRCVMSR